MQKPHVLSKKWFTHTVVQLYISIYINLFVHRGIKTPVPRITPWDGHILWRQLRCVRDLYYIVFEETLSFCMTKEIPFGFYYDLLL